MKQLFENWRELIKESRGPKDFHYKIIESPLKKEILVLDLSNKQPVPGKAKGDAKIIIEKRTHVPHWQVTWSNSPEGTEGIGTIMYLMAMELAGNEGFSPDDYEQSDDALRVWAKFMPKNNIYNIFKEKKEEFKYEGDENPFFFVFFKPDSSFLRQYKKQISSAVATKVEKPVFEPEIKPFDPNDPKEWEEIDELYENKQNDTNKVSKVIILNKNGQVLLLRRADKPYFWDLPGGHLKKGENYKQGAAREAKEETNLNISTFKHINDHQNIKFFLCQAPKGDVFLQPDEHIDYKWVNPKEISKYNMKKPLKRIVKSELDPVRCGIDVGSATLHAELAITPEETARGLMFRKKPLGDRYGMLFVMPEEKNQIFHMKNTFIPLDMIFIDKNKKIVGIIERTEPQSFSPCHINAASSYVLEVDGGWCSRNNVKAGQFVKIYPLSYK